MNEEKKKPQNYERFEDPNYRLRNGDETHLDDRISFGIEPGMSRDYGNERRYYEKMQGHEGRPEENRRPPGAERLSSGRDAAFPAERRSDEHISESVAEAFAARPGVDTSLILIEVKDGQIILRGEAADEDTKRAAESMAKESSRSVKNEIAISQRKKAS